MLPSAFNKVVMCVALLCKLATLGFQSRHLVDRIEDESIWLRGPDLADVFVGALLHKWGEGFPV